MSSQHCNKPYDSLKGSSNPLRRASQEIPPPPSSPSSTISLSSTSDWAFKQLFTDPPSNEIPLRTTYTNNVLAQRNQNAPLTPTKNRSSFRSRTPTREHPNSPTQVAGDHFKSCLMAQQNHLPSQPSSLPPSFITSFVRKVFTEDLCLVDFTQALTAMDYLKFLDDRRKRELQAALRRLNIDHAMQEHERMELNNTYPGIWEWVARMEDKSKKAEALYTQVYINLRKWALINEMRLTPFNKPTRLALLNTLYPPSYPVPPTAQLTDTILNSQRNVFFRYIQAVDKNGKHVLKSLEHSGRRSGEANGWPVTHDIIELYLKKANGVIEECISVKGPEDFEYKGTGKRADSGVSFSSIQEKRPSTSHVNAYEKRPSTSHVHSHSSSYDKPLPAHPCMPPSPKRAESAFGRLARELRRIKSRSADSKDETDSRNSPRRGLRQMKSTSNLTREASSSRNGKHSRGSSSDRGALYEMTIDDAARERLIREARRDKASRTPSPGDARSASTPPRPTIPRSPATSPQLHPPSPPPQTQATYMPGQTYAQPTYKSFYSSSPNSHNPYELPIEELTIAELP